MVSCLSTPALAGASCTYVVETKRFEGGLGRTAIVSEMGVDLDQRVCNTVRSGGLVPVS